MALIRALNIAISGLRAHQTRVDAVGNNLANVDTTAFKSARVQFETILSQTYSFGTAPSGNLGGIDPRQVGLGVQAASISKNFSQGALKSTGIASDLAIEGDGWFILNDQNGTPVYTRDGTFSINPSNLLHNPTNGFIVQGWMADFTTFQVSPGGPTTNVQIPIGDLRIARETDNVFFDGNFDSSGDIANSGTVLESEQLINITTGLPAVLTTLLTDLGKDGPGGPIDFNLDIGDIIEIRATKGNRSLPMKRFIVSPTPPPPGIDDSGTTVQDLIDFMEDALGITTSVVSGLDTDTYSALITTGSVEAGDVVTSTTYTKPGTDFVALGVEVGDYIRWTSGVGTGQIGFITAIGGVGNDTLTFNPLDPTLPLPAVGNNWEINEKAKVGLGTGGIPPVDVMNEDAQSPAGVIRVSANVGTANAISNLELTENGQRLTVFTEIAQARGESNLANITAYDSLGNPHTVEITYALQYTNDFRIRVMWFAESESNNGIRRTLGTGYVDFDENGQFVAENPLSAITIDLQNSGANTPLVFSVNHSSVPALANGISEIAMIDQDGYAQGTLTDYTVGADGIITGIFSNGITRTIAQIALARFANNNGLFDAGDNIFRVGTNSGQPIVGTPGTFGRGFIRSGFLEESNVDMALEFTNLIVSQRAFQANARVIRAADEMLQDLVSVV